MAFNKKKLIPIITVGLFFFAYLFMGSQLYKDYGVSTDEPVEYKTGRIAYQRFTGGSQAQFEASCAKLDIPDSCKYPPFFSMLLYRLVPYGYSGSIPLAIDNNIAPGSNSPNLYYQRHKLTFAFFAFAVFVFFLIGKKIFQDWKIGLLGSLFLILSPRIFGNSFYNPKDIPFLSAYVISIYTLLMFLERKNLITAVLHGIATAVVCSIRIPGIIIIPITIFFYLVDLFLSKEFRTGFLKAAGLMLSFLSIAAGLIYWFDPFLYPDPIRNYIISFNLMKHYPWSGIQVYLGQNISNKVPWHYSIVWFSISSPFFYLLLFIIGMGFLITHSIKTRSRAHFLAMQDIYMVAACAILPIAAVIVTKATLYNDNRQMYFCYPPLLLISLYGFVELMGLIRKRFVHWQVWITVILALGLAQPVYFMVRYHPYEEFYFNFLAGSKMSVIKQRFTLDSWMMTSKDALEYILKTDPNKYITVSFSIGSPKSVLLLSPADRQRLVFHDKGGSEYVIDWYLGLSPLKLPAGTTIYYSIKIDDSDILTVYKMNKN
jgi:hypothetical protein